MDKYKSLLASKGIWAAAIIFIANLFNFDASPEDIEEGTQVATNFVTVMLANFDSIVIAVGSVIAFYGRLVASKKLSLDGSAPANRL